ncbi:hypothetical protein MKK75_19705 [Methylobacterium sp. J-030]|uniref:hypothetical protein n=1 Tax=Methylobacterium sp. J-030 TaxID=2836627 RepID=UPI001FB89A42|nr:hypothetical protein [Methylobacterium sp. J-030]MCJ2070987.1 hypothetical protein [Methylobacterium sp. J-030]
MAEFDKTAYAAERGLEDTKAANATTQATGQILILINGGASTATLTFAAAGSPPIRIDQLVLGSSLILFALGVIYATKYMGYQGRRLEDWSTYWSARAGMWPDEMGASARDRANDLDKKVGFAFRVSVISFVLGVTFLGLDIILQPIVSLIKVSYPTTHFWF